MGWPKAQKACQMVSEASTPRFRLETWRIWPPEHVHKPHVDIKYGKLVYIYTANSYMEYIVYHNISTISHNISYS